MRSGRSHPGILALASLLLVLAADGQADEPREVPLPTTRTAVLRDTDVVYVVEGRQRIPPGVEVTGQQGIRVKGRGGAVLEVRGALVVHGVSDNDVSIQGVTIELEDEVKQLHLDHCKLGGGSCVVTPEGKSAHGAITIENCDFDSAPGLSLALTGGKVKVMSVTTGPAVRIRGVDGEAGRNRVYAMVYGGTLTGLEVENVDDLTVRGALLKGSPLRLRDNRILVFDGNRVEGASLAFEHAEAGLFKGTQVTKCDLLCSTVRFFAPATAGKSDRVILDKCWFGGETNVDAIMKVVEDRDDDPANNVKVLVKSPTERPHRPPER